MRTLICWITDMITYWITGINGNGTMDLFEFIRYMDVRNDVEDIVTFVIVLIIVSVVVSIIGDIINACLKEENCKKVEAESK